MRQMQVAKQNSSSKVRKESDTEESVEDRLDAQYMLEKPQSNIEVNSNKRKHEKNEKNEKKQTL